MGYIYIPETKRAKDVRIDNYDKKFPSNVNNVELALRYLKENNSLNTYQFIDLRDVGIEFSNEKTIVESLDTLIDTCNPKINQVYKGKCLASDNPSGVANAEIEITILKHLLNDKQEDTIDNRDIICQIVLSSIDVEPYKWFMITERVGSDINSTIKVALRPMLPSEQSIDLSNYATINDLNDKADKNNLVATNSISMGRKNSSTIGSSSFATGKDCTATGNCSHAEGYYSSATGNFSHAEGYYSSATNDYSHAEGVQTTASGAASHAEGNDNKATGNCSHAEGAFTIASGDYSHVQGKFNIEDTTNKYAHIVGNGKYYNTRSNAHTLDWNGNAWYAGKLSQEGTPTEDKDLTTKKYVDDKVAGLVDSAPETLDTLNELSTALGNDPNFATTMATTLGNKVDKVDGKTLSTNDLTNELKANYDVAYTHSQSAHFNGDYNSLSNIPTDLVKTSDADSKYAPIDSPNFINAISMGRANGNTIGANSVALGTNVIASGENSHAEGLGATASGNYSHAEGYDVRAYSAYQHVQGKCNVEDTSGRYAHIVGNGDDTDLRSNAHTVDWNGNAWYQGDIYTGGKGQDDTNAKKMATEEFVNNIISNLLSFNDNGELIVTIGDVSKTFVAKTE